MNPWTPHPSQATIIFSGAHQPSKIEALRLKKVDAAMCSFDFFKSPKRWVIFHRDIAPCFSWPVRLYLDSGIYSLMRRAGVSRAKVHLDADRDKDPKRFFKTPEEALAAFEKLANSYLDYLADHHEMWDHITELDVDQIFGLEVTKQWRTKLKAVVGDRLLPVWHQSAGFGEWEALVDEFKYVGIGGDAGVGAGMRTEAHLAEYRHMVDYAHSRGVAVQGFGDTRLRTFLATHWDSSDSTTWLTSQKYGQVGHLKLSAKVSSAHSAQGFAKARSWMDWAREEGIDPERVIEEGTTIDKLLCWVVLLQYRQTQIREIFTDQGIRVWQPEKHPLSVS